MFKPYIRSSLAIMFHKIPTVEVREVLSSIYKLQITIQTPSESSFRTHTDRANTIYALLPVSWQGDNLLTFEFIYTKIYTSTYSIFKSSQEIPLILCKKKIYHPYAVRQVQYSVQYINAHNKLNNQLLINSLLNMTSGFYHRQRQC